MALSSTRTDSTPVRVATAKAISPRRGAPSESMAIPGTPISPRAPPARALFSGGAVVGSTPGPRAPPPAADGDQHGVDAAGLLEQFETHRALTRADLRLVIGVTKQGAAVGRMLDGRVVGVGVLFADLPDIGAELAQFRDLDRGRGLRD